MAQNVEDRVEAAEPLVLENPHGRSLSYLIRRFHVPNRVEDILNRTFARRGMDARRKQEERPTRRGSGARSAATRTGSGVGFGASVDKCRAKTADGGGY